jgi:steroid 5-alpha reductase family enzyme
MTSLALSLLALGAALASAATAGLWLTQARTRDASHVDVGGATGIAFLAVLYALPADGSTGHRVLAAALATVLGGRLGVYLLRDHVLGKNEEGRYRALPVKWGSRAKRTTSAFVPLPPRADGAVRRVTS